MTDNPAYQERRHWSGTFPRVWEGPRRQIARFNMAHHLVQIGWWYEPEQKFVPVTEEAPPITGSAHPVYCEVGD